MLPTAKAVLYCCVPLPLLLNESSIISITISPGFPTALLLTIIAGAACSAGSLSHMQVHVGFDWLGVQPGVIFMSSCEADNALPGRAQFLPSGFGKSIAIQEKKKHWGKYCNPGKMLPQRGSRQQVSPGVGGPAPAGGHWPRWMPARATLVAVPMPPWHVSWVAGLQGMTKLSACGFWQGSWL